MENNLSLKCLRCLNFFRSKAAFERHFQFCNQEVDEMSFLGPDRESLRRENCRVGPTSAFSNLNDTMNEVKYKFF